MQDRIRVKKIMKAAVQRANQVKDALNINGLINQAITHIKKGREERKKQRKN